MKLMKALGYSENYKFLGRVTNLSLLSETVTLQDIDGDSATFDVEDVQILEEVLTLSDGTVIFDKDVLSSNFGVSVMVTKVGDNKIRLDALDENLDVEQVGVEKEITNFLIKMLDSYPYENITNYYELINSNVKEAHALDFNVEIVKDIAGTYYYACNDKNAEVIDLITVVFVGAKILEGEYEREELDYNEYLELLDEEDLIKVSEGELQNHAYNLLRKANEVEYGEFEEDLEEEEYSLEDGSECGLGCAEPCELCSTEELEEEDDDTLKTLENIFSTYSDTTNTDNLGKQMEQAQRIAQEIIKNMRSQGRV